MINIPGLPDREEFEYKEKEFFLRLYEQYQASSKLWFVLLAATIIVAVPANLLMSGVIANTLISRYQPPPVNLNSYTPQDLKILKVQLLPVISGLYSVYGQVLNPNPDISVSELDYHFDLKDARGNILQSPAGHSYLIAGESKFLLMPTVTVAGTPASADLVFDKVNWTKRQPKFDIRLDVLQQNAGLTPEGNFFVEGLLRNQQGVQIRTVQLGVLVFDSQNQNVIAINTSQISDLVPNESRYFRVLWPTGRFAAHGQIQVVPGVNLLDPVLILEKTPPIPTR